MFHSSPAASSLDFIGGPAILLGLISLATDDHTMYAAVKVLHLVLTSNAMCDRLMQQIFGYQVIPLSHLSLQLPKGLLSGDSGRSLSGHSAHSLHSEFWRREV